MDSPYHKTFFGISPPRPNFFAEAGRLTPPCHAPDGPAGSRARGAQALQPALAQRDVEAAADDDCGAQPGPAVGKLGEEEPADDGGADQLDVAHGCHHRGAAPLE